MTRIILLRHAETEKDKTKNAKEWVLSERGVEEAKNLATNQDFNNVSQVFVSSEAKAGLTAQFLLEKLGLEFEINADFDEVHRGDKFYSDEEFAKEKDKQFADLNYNAFDGESLTKAVSRFKKGISSIIENYPGETILLVTHGTVLNAYLADEFGYEKELLKRWGKTGFTNYAIIENGQLIKDIV